MTSIPAALRGLGVSELHELHAAGSAPSPDSFSGALPGAVLGGTLARPLLRDLRLWRGKVFDHGPAGLRGINRLGVGPLEIHRYRFDARAGRSHFSDRPVVLLDHDRPDNPGRVRRFHDELVAIDVGLYVATSHHCNDDGLRFLCHFALWDPSTTTRS